MSQKEKGVLYHRGYWWARLYVNGKQHWYSCTSQAQARKLYTRLRAEVLEQRFDPARYKQHLTLAQWITRCLEGCTNRDVAHERYCGKEWTALLGSRPLSDITTEELRHQQAKMRAGGRAEGTVNRYFAFLRKVLNLALKDGLIGRNPMNGVRFFPEQHNTRFLNDQELTALEGQLRPNDWKLVLFSVETMLRQSEQFGLRWSHVNLEAGILSIPRSKSGKTRHVSLSDTAKAILRSLDSFAYSPWVFPSDRDPNTARYARSFVEDVFMPALRKAGIQGAVWHSLRHTGISRRAMHGVDLVTLKELAGHQAIATTMRYAHLVPTHVQASVNKGSFLGKNENQTVVKTVVKQDV